MKIVQENINEKIKYLNPKSEEELYKVFQKIVDEIADKEGSHLINGILDEISDHISYQDGSAHVPYNIMRQFIKNIPEDILRETIIQTLNDFIYG